MQNRGLAMSRTLIFGLIGLLGIAVIAMYLPSVVVGTLPGEVTVSAIRETPKGQRIHRLEVKLGSGAVVAVRTHAMRTVDPGTAITVSQRVSWLGRTYYTWQP